jgi:hypothetical protein
LDDRKITFKEILDNILTTQDQLESLEGSGRVTVESPEFSGHFFADIIFLASDSLRITVSGPFGIQAGTLFIGKERFIFYNQMANKFYNGSVQEYQDKKFFQFPLTLSELTNVLVGKETILSSMKILEYGIDDDMFFIRSQKAGLHYQIWIDHHSGQIRKIKGMQDGETIFVREYDDFVKLNGLYFPRKITMNRALERQAVSVYYTKLALNGEVNREKFVINVSDRAMQMDYQFYTDY